MKKGVRVYDSQNMPKRVLKGDPENPRCDFCWAPPEFAYDCADFDMQGLVVELKGGGEVPLIPPSRSVGYWAACAGCAALIEQGALDALVERAVAANTAREGVEWHAELATERRQVFRANYETFLRRRRGPARPFRQVPIGNGIRETRNVPAGAYQIGPVTPELALKLRDDLLAGLREQWSDVVRDSRMVGDAENHDRVAEQAQIGLAALLSGAALEPVLWERSLAAAAQRGAEVFAGTTLGAGVCPKAAQLWLHQEGCALQSQGVWAALPEQCAFLGALLVPLPGLIPSVIPLEILLFAEPGEMFRLDRVRLLVFPPLTEGELVPPESDIWAARLTFLSIDLVAQEPHVWPRQQRRQYERRGLTPPLVSTVGLRRRVRKGRPGEVDRSEYQYQYQWPVKGHWRRQWHGPSKPRQPTFIRPHLKGPDDKPLKPPKESVYLVKR